MITNVRGKQKSMATRNMQLKSKFYKQCQQQGCADMNDSTHRRKAKAIAKDLGLFFNDIDTLYNEAKECYEASKKQAKDKKRAKENAQRVADGELLLTISNQETSDNNAQVLKVYIRADKSIFSLLNDGPKKEGSPTIQATKTGTTLLTYKPSEAVYTSATVGGITTGGIHYTKSGYEVGGVASGKGEIIVRTAEVEFFAQKIIMTDYTKEKFKRDSQYHSLVKNGRILCYQKTAMSEVIGNGVEIAAQQGDYTLMMNAASMFADECRIPFKNCVDIADLISRIVNGNFPPTEEEIYESALADSNSTDPKDLERAIKAFYSIYDFKDSDKRANELQIKYDEILQHKKEQAILKGEAVEKNIKRSFKIITVTANLIVTAILTLLTIGFWLLDDYSLVAAILASISVIISLPGIGKLIFRKKYGFLQRILRWVLVVVILLIALIIISF